MTRTNGHFLIRRVLTQSARLTVGVLLLAWPLHMSCAAGSARDVEKMFVSGAKSTPPAVTAAKSQYEVLKRARPNDARVEYAYGLVLVAQHRYREALPKLDQYIENNPGDLTAR